MYDRSTHSSLSKVTHIYVTVIRRQCFQTFYLQYFFLQMRKGIEKKNSFIKVFEAIKVISFKTKRALSFHFAIKQNKYRIKGCIHGFYFKYNLFKYFAY